MSRICRTLDLDKPPVVDGGVHERHLVGAAMVDVDLPGLQQHPHGLDVVVPAGAVQQRLARVPDRVVWIAAAVEQRLERENGKQK